MPCHELNMVPQIEGISVVLRGSILLSLGLSQIIVALDFASAQGCDRLQSQQYHGMGCR